MERSETLGKLASALAKAQAAMPRAELNSVNPFLKNRYADLDAVWEAARGPLAENGLSVTQFPTGTANAIGLTTILLHESGEWIGDTIYLPLAEERGKSQAQVAGSIISYLRRYGLSAALGITTGDDDDGNAGQDPRGERQRPPAKNTAGTPARTPAGLPDAGPFYGSVMAEVGYFRAVEHVKKAMNLLGLSYPTSAPEARAHRALLEKYATLRADGIEPSEAVARVKEEQQPGAG